MTIRNPDYSILPEHMQGAFKRYIENGIPPGGFAEAILANDLVGAARCADHINCHLLFEYARWLSEECPRAAWGSYEAVEEWIDHHTVLDHRQRIAEDQTPGKE